MRQILKPHRDSPPSPATSIGIEVARHTPEALTLHFALAGAIDGLTIPNLAKSARTDDLWRNTCFEAFIRTAAGEAYCEFNFSPSTEWAAYRFTHYRNAMTPIDELAPPLISPSLGANRLDLHARLDLSGLSDLSPQATWRLGLSAVIEDAAGQKSYWALVHPPGRPDFHHADSFALDLPPPEPK